MAIDYYIKFEKKVPRKGELKSIALNYVGADVANIEEKDENFFMINLPGKTSNPFEGIPEAHKLSKAYETRWVELNMYKKKTLAVTTRSQDEYTNCVAGGIARCIARWYEAQLKEPS